jgi:L-ascorbate metabolism protein UlaG (beta-lactamase superfamily)
VNDALTAYLGFARRYTRYVIRERREPLFQPIPPAPHSPEPATWPSDRLTLAWLGHATVLLNIFGTWVITDPALRSRVGLRLGLGTLGPRRLVQPALRIRELPPLDLVLVSHAHMDHLDRGTLGRLPPRTHVVTSRGNRDLLERFEAVHELDWGEETHVGGLTIRAIPARHWGARMLTDHHRGYGGFLIEGHGIRIVFTGDTAYTDTYREIGAEAPTDLAIVPIGAYDPWIDNHASPEQAWAMSRDLRARHVLPVHHSTFRLSREPLDEPVRRFLAAAGEERWRVAATAVGETWRLPR